MKLYENTMVREYASGIGSAVADRTINRLITDNITGEKRRETWAEVSDRVAIGNASLSPPGLDRPFEYSAMKHHLSQASILMSGRHLQHGDITQHTRNIEVFTNCATAAASNLSFYLLLNGSGVGRCYDDDMMIVDWRNMPIVIPVIDMHHPDSTSGEIDVLDIRSAQHLYQDTETVVFDVPDSREGWAQAIELIETMSAEEIYRKSVLLLDFSKVRERGAPISGMQDRPASGPGPLMIAINKIAALRNSNKAPWFQTLYIDHYAAECVLVGGARRAARMATKSWRDKSVLEFINIKRGGFLWSANNSVTIDQEFWSYVKGDVDPLSRIDYSLMLHAREVYNAVIKAAYYDETGEPGFINVDLLTQNDDGMIAAYGDGDNWVKSKKFIPSKASQNMLSRLYRIAKTKQYNMITNPCGEITLFLLGGYCVIGDVVPYHASSDEDAEDAFRVMTRALIRTNTMDSLYGNEVRRTNRIGVGMTGIHEYAWIRFGLSWKELVDETKSLDFWNMLARFKRAVVDEAEQYSIILGVNIPHTNTTIKPAGCATLDTTVVTTNGLMTLLDIFRANGYELSDIEKMEDGTWLDLTIPVSVMDENNEAKDITKLYVNGQKPVYEIEFEDGHTVKLTGNHKLKTNTGWKRVDELSDDDDVISY